MGSMAMVTSGDSCPCSVCLVEEFVNIFILKNLAYPNAISKFPFKYLRQILWNLQKFRNKYQSKIFYGKEL